MTKALVVQGGGARAIYAAGVLDVFLDAGISFDQIYGTSAGALFGANFLSGDRGRSLDVLSVMLKGDKRFVSLDNFFRKGNAFDFHYLIEELPELGYPFNREKFSCSPTEFYAVTTSCETGESVYVEKSEKRFFKALGASCTLIPFSRPVEVDGERMYDGGYSAKIPFERAVQENIDKIVVIVTRDRDYKPENPRPHLCRLAKVLARGFPNFLAAFQTSGDKHAHDLEVLRQLEREGRALVIYPSSPLDLKVVEKDCRKVQNAYDLGSHDALSMLGQIKDFLGI